MNTTDPVIPDDLSELLRTASAQLAVAPSGVEAVERRGRQRRRRRRRAIATGAAAVLLCAGLAIAQVATDDRPEQVITATTVAPAPAATVPQPLLLWGEPIADHSFESGSWLDEITLDGPVHWWRSEPGTEAVRGAVLADGRRFGLSVGQTDATRGQVTVDEVGADGRTVRSIALDSAAGAEPESAQIDLVGASGTELLLQRSAEGPRTPMPGGGYSVEMVGSVTALDVDTGVERIIEGDIEDGSAATAGADDVIVRAPGTDCMLDAQPIDGTGPHRTFSGGCPDGRKGLRGLATAIAVSPDGRMVATVWNVIQPAGAADFLLRVIDLETGAVVHSADTGTQAPVTRLSWTGERTLSAATTPGKPAIASGGGIDVVSVPYVAS